MRSLVLRRAIFGLVALATLAAATPAAARSVAEIRKSGELVMLSYLGANESFLRAVPGGYEGLDYELVAGFARTLGVRLRVVAKPRFIELIPALLAGEGDLIASTMSITSAREEQVDFTKPYFPVVTMVLARKGSGLSGLGSVAGKRVGVPPGTTLEARAAKLGFASVTGNARGAAEALRVLANDEVDVVLMESSLALPVLARETRLELVATLPEVEQYGMAVPPGSDLRPALDTFLASTRNGRSFYQLVLRYLGEHGVRLLKGNGAPQPTR